MKVIGPYETLTEKYEPSDTALHQRTLEFSTILLSEARICVLVYLMSVSVFCVVTLHSTIRSVSELHTKIQTLPKNIKFKIRNPVAKLKVIGLTSTLPCAFTAWR
jgi:hypothetical protein